MITVDQFMDIKSRHQNGQSIGSIEQTTGHARNTVRKVLRGEHAIENSKQRTRVTSRASKLDEFKDYIRKRVDEFENLCLACPTCNRHKAIRVVGLTNDGVEARLSHPQQDNLLDHFD